jgi:hypothetical protein
LQAPGVFGVPGRRFVAEHGGVSEEQHADDVAPTATRAKCGVSQPWAAIKAVSR